MKKLMMFLPMALLCVMVACANDDGTSVERREFQEQVEEQVAEFNQQIEAAKREAEELSGDDRFQMDETIQELEEQRDNVVAELEEMREASDEQWEAARQEVQGAIDDLGQRLSEIEENFKSSLSSTDSRRS